jgi:hypothetical protein
LYLQVKGGPFAPRSPVIPYHLQKTPDWGTAVHRREKSVNVRRTEAFADTVDAVATPHWSSKNVAESKIQNGPSSIQNSQTDEIEKSLDTVPVVNDVTTLTTQERKNELADLEEKKEVFDGIQDDFDTEIDLQSVSSVTDLENHAAKEHQNGLMEEESKLEKSQNPPQNNADLERELTMNTSHNADSLNIDDILDFDL